MIAESERLILQLAMATTPFTLEPVRVVARDRSLRRRYMREHYQRVEALEEHEIGRTLFPRVELAR